VVVLDERGKFVISLLSGHLGGANALAREVAEVTGGQAVITTASDVQNKPALDLIAQEAGLEIENLPAMARFTRAVLEDEPFWIYDPYRIISNHFSGMKHAFFLSPDTEDRLRQPSSAPKAFNSRGNIKALDLDGEARGYLRQAADSIGVWVSERNPPQDLPCVILRPRNLVVGLGCNRGTPASEVFDLLRLVFVREGLSLLSIRNLASIDLKSDERGFQEVAQSLDRPIHFFSRVQLSTVSVPNPSDTVARHVGVHSVCEATALLSAQAQVLLVSKQKTPNVTLAVARAPSMW
jgi:cobalt-precorrin 5A hydrolase